ncbi:MAG: VWA domain-containing protein [Gammaproteobacteria bacterium]|nr:VWA domain-containing protein [Gammaproteobacteria bacterium]
MHPLTTEKSDLIKQLLGELYKPSSKEHSLEIAVLEAGTGQFSISVKHALYLETKWSSGLSFSLQYRPVNSARREQGWLLQATFNNGKLDEVVEALRQEIEKQKEIAKQKAEAEAKAAEERRVAEEAGARLPKVNAAPTSGGRPMAMFMPFPGAARPGMFGAIPPCFSPSIPRALPSSLFARGVAQKEKLELERTRLSARDWVSYGRLQTTEEMGEKSLLLREMQKALLASTQLKQLIKIILKNQGDLQGITNEQKSALKAAGVLPEQDKDITFPMIFFQARFSKNKENAEVFCKKYKGGLLTLSGRDSRERYAVYLSVSNMQTCFVDSCDLRAEGASESTLEAVSKSETAAVLLTAKERLCQQLVGTSSRSARETFLPLLRMAEHYQAAYGTKIIFDEKTKARLSEKERAALKKAGENLEALSKAVCTFLFRDEEKADAFCKKFSGGMIVRDSIRGGKEYMIYLAEPGLKKLAEDYSVYCEKHPICAIAERSAVPVGENAKMMLEINLPEPRQGSPENVPNKKIVLMLDESGSMEGDKITNLLACTRKLVEVLKQINSREKQGEGISLVVCAFNLRERTLFDSEKNAWDEAVPLLTEEKDGGSGTYRIGGSGTDIGLALTRGVAHLAHRQKHNAHMVLLTDGANGDYSLRSEEGVRKALGSYVGALSVVGLGADYDHRLLGRIRRIAQGLMYDIKGAEEIDAAVSQIVGALAEIIEPCELTLKSGVSCEVYDPITDVTTPIQPGESVMIFPVRGAPLPLLVTRGAVTLVEDNDVEIKCEVKIANQVTEVVVKAEVSSADKPMAVHPEVMLIEFKKRYQALREEYAKACEETVGDEKMTSEERQQASAELSAVRAAILDQMAQLFAGVPVPLRPAFTEMKAELVSLRRTPLAAAARVLTALNGGSNISGSSVWASHAYNVATNSSATADSSATASSTYKGLGK